MNAHHTLRLRLKPRHVEDSHAMMLFVIGEEGEQFVLERRRRAKDRLLTVDQLLHPRGPEHEMPQTLRRSPLLSGVGLAALRHHIPRHSLSPIVEGAAAATRVDALLPSASPTSAPQKT